MNASKEEVASVSHANQATTSPIQALTPMDLVWLKVELQPKLSMSEQPPKVEMSKPLLVLREILLTIFMMG